MIRRGHGFKSMRRDSWWSVLKLWAAIRRSWVASRTRKESQSRSESVNLRYAARVACPSMLYITYLIYGVIPCIVCICGNQLNNLNVNRWTLTREAGNLGLVFKSDYSFDLNSSVLILSPLLRPGSYVSTGGRIAGLSEGEMGTDTPVVAGGQRTSSASFNFRKEPQAKRSQNALYTWRSALSKQHCEWLFLCDNQRHSFLWT